MKTDNSEQLNKLAAFPLLIGWGQIKFQNRIVNFFKAFSINALLIFYMGGTYWTKFVERMVFCQIEGFYWTIRSEGWVKVIEENHLYEKEKRKLITPFF